MTEQETARAWRELVNHCEKWVGGPRWSGGNVEQAPALRPEMVAGLAAVGGIHRVAYRTAAEDRQLRAMFAWAYGLRVKGGAA